MMVDAMASDAEDYLRTWKHNLRRKWSVTAAAATRRTDGQCITTTQLRTPDHTAAAAAARPVA